MAKLLIVEDDLVSSESIRLFLEHSNHQILDVVTTGSDAIRRARELAPDLILMDIYLRDQVDGITAAATIYQQFGVPIIYLSGNTEDAVLQRAIATKPFGYLVKPFNQVELITTISIALQHSHLEKQLERTEQWLATTLNSIGDGTIAIDCEGQITFINPAAETITGWSEAEALGQPVDQVLNLVHEETHVAIANPLLQVIHTGEALILPEDGVLRTKQGQERAIGDSAAPIRDRNGEILGGILVFQDISDRKREKDLLYRREQEFRALVEHSPDIIARFDRDFRHLYVNPTIETITGIPVAAFIGRSNRELGMPDVLNTLWEQTFRQVFATAQEQTIEFETVTLNGLRHFQARIVPECDPAGQVETILSVARDITDRKQVEEALRLQADREKLLGMVAQRIRESLQLHDILTTAVNEVRQLLQADRVVVYRFEPDWSGFVITEAIAPGWMPLLGRKIYDPCLATEDCILPFARGQISVIDNVATSPLASCYLELLQQFQVQANLVIPILHTERLWGLIAVQQCASPRQWQDWEIDFLSRLSIKMSIAVHQAELYTEVQRLNSNLESQILERTVQVQQALAFEALLKRITDNVRDSLDETQILQTAVTELGLGIGVDYCRAAIYDSDSPISAITYEFGAAPTCLNPDREFLVLDDLVVDLSAQLLQGHYCQFCFPNVSVSSSANNQYTILACPILDDHEVLGDLWLVRPAIDTFSEIEIRLVEQVANQGAIALRQSRLYQAAQAQVTELERLNQLKDDFLSTVSHELRTPMANIKMAVQMVLTVLRPLPVFEDFPALDRYFQILQKECDREIALIDNLLKLSRLDAESEPLNLSTVDPVLWISHTAEPFLQQVHDQQLTLELNLPETLPPLRTDLSYLAQILTELLTNACKYSPRGHTIMLSAQAIAHTLHIRVTNTGIEIPASELPRIFDTFYRIPNPDPWRYAGTGIGLALVKKLVAHIGGAIAVESGANQTTFILMLPIPNTEVA